MRASLLLACAVLLVPTLAQAEDLLPLEPVLEASVRRNIDAADQSRVERLSTQWHGALKKRDASLFKNIEGRVDLFLRQQVDSGAHDISEDGRSRYVDLAREFQSLAGKLDGPSVKRKSAIFSEMIRITVGPETQLAEEKTEETPAKEQQAQDVR